MKIFVPLMLFASLVQMFYCFFEVTLTGGNALTPGDKEYVNLDKLRVRKYNKSGHYAIGEFETFKEMNDEFELCMILYKKAGNDYKLTPFRVGPYKLCEYVKNYAITYDEVRAVSNLPPRDECPIKVETYEIRGYRLPTEKIPPFFDGEYKAELQLIYNKMIVNGYAATFTVLKL